MGAGEPIDSMASVRPPLNISFRDCAMDGSMKLRQGSSHRVLPLVVGRWGSIRLIRAYTADVDPNN